MIPDEAPATNHALGPAESPNLARVLLTECVVFHGLQVVSQMPRNIDAMRAAPFHDIAD